MADTSLTAQFTNVLTHPSALPALLRSLYNRAPASVATLASLLISFIYTKARSDYLTWKSIGPGGFAAAPDIRGWLLQTFILRPMAMRAGNEKNPDYLPPPDKEMDMRMTMILRGLRKREGQRPATYGLMPHRQLEDKQPEDGEMQKELTAHIKGLAERNAALSTSISVVEAHTSPSLVYTAPRPTGEAVTGPSKLSKLFLSGLHAPRNDASSTSFEFFHIHMHDSSCHVILSPQHARKVIELQHGELHRLAGAFFFRGHWLSPWQAGSQRWAYLGQTSTQKAKLLPPTYLILYAPRNEAELEQVKAIIDAAAAWAMGHAPA